MKTVARQPQFKDILLNILDIIQYPNNKQKFIAEFEEQNYLDAMLNIIERFPNHIQDEIKTRDIASEIQKHVSSEEYTEELITVSREALMRFLKVVSPYINLDQKQKISDLLMGDKMTSIYSSNPLQ